MMSGLKNWIPVGKIKQGVNYYSGLCIDKQFMFLKIVIDEFRPSVEPCFNICQVKGFC